MRRSAPRNAALDNELAAREGLSGIPKVRSFHVIRIYADVSKDRLIDLRKEITQIEQHERQVI